MKIITIYASASAIERSVPLVPRMQAGVSSGRPGDLRMALAIWPTLLAAALSLVPFTVFSTLLVPIAADAGGSVAAVGGLRGLGGIAALVVGVGVAPLLDRIPRERAAAAALLVLGLSAAVGALGSVPALAVFCLLTGAATALLTPALMAAAADRFPDAAGAARAATLVTATTSLTAMLVAPLVALPALVWGWRGDLLAVLVVAVVLAGELLRRGAPAPTAAVAPRAGYLAALRQLAAVPGAIALLVAALLRTAAFMGYLAYLAALYDERFGLPPTLFALVWTVSGASFFLANLLAGRWLSAEGGRFAPERVLVVGLAVATAAMLAVHLVAVFAVAVAGTAVLAMSHAAVAAAVTTLLVRRCTGRRGAALALNAAAMSLGVFVGAAVGGLGLAVAGFPGVGVALAALTVGALLAALRVR